MRDISSLSDEKIVEIVRSKDKEQYAEIIRRYQVRLMRYATYLVGESHTAADVVQEAFIKAFINLNGFDLKKKFSSWIYRIVHNEAMNVISKDKKKESLDDHMQYASNVDITDDVIKQELVQHANHCLEKMPILYKEPLSLYFLDEKSYEEISDILRIPVATVGTRINRAKGVMKKICQTQNK